MAKPILYETHMHTPLCKHAHGNPEEYAQIARRRGLKGITVTCHNPLPSGMSSQIRMDMDEFSDYVELVANAAEICRPWCDVQLGLECDYLPGLVGFLKEQAEWAPFDYLLGSVHPQIPEYNTLFWDGDPVAFHKKYFEHLAMAAETGLFDCLSHPDLVKNCYSVAWDVGRILDHIRECLDRIAVTGVCMEFNTSGRYKVVREFNPGNVILAEMHKRRIPVVVGADAHQPDRVGEGYEVAFDTLEAVGYTSINYFKQRKRIQVNIADARASLNTPAAAG